jgi:hypothetical protein
MSKEGISATARYLRAELLDKQRNLAPSSMLDCAAHMLLYLDSQNAVHRHLACCRGLDLVDNGPHRWVAGNKAGGCAPDGILKPLGSWRQIVPRGRRTCGLAAFKSGLQHMDVAIGDRRAPPCVQYDDRADAGGAVVHEIEARVRQDFLQFGWPFLEGDGL